MHYMYQPKNVCAKLISFDLEGDVVHNVEFVGGCNGNLKAISKVVDGMTVAQVENYFTGIDCGGRGTSCSAQLALGLREALSKAAQA